MRLMGVFWCRIHGIYIENPLPEAAVLWYIECESIHDHHDRWRIVKMDLHDYDDVAENDDLYLNPRKM